MSIVSQGRKIVQPIYNSWMHFGIPSRKAAVQLVGDTLFQLTGNKYTQDECEMITTSCENAYIRREYAKKILVGLCAIEWLAAACACVAIFML